ncbi:MFS domain-containing protein [Mycena kentingensis (nom. inval.)]|nr:MFS domain-containing protein [Mycena kentingensis (nom. inval.)]
MSTSTSNAETSVEPEDAVLGKEQQITPPDLDFPDGGWRAWSIVIGVIASNASTFGFVNAWGVFQAYYQTTLLKEVSPSDIAWIGSIQYSLVFLPGLVTGRLFDLGYFRIPCLVASTLLVALTFLVGECHQYWHFVLCQGVGIGLMAGMIFGPCLGCLGHWFNKRRGVAFGWAATGSSIGGTIFPIATHKLIPLVGFPWTMRICGFILIFTLSIANLTLARRLPPKRTTGGLLNLTAFKNSAYTTYCLNGFVSFLGLYTLLTYVEVSAVENGVSPDFSFYLVAIANGCSLVGRVGAGLAADRWGPLNVLIPMTLSVFIAIAALYGVVSGTYVSTFPIPILGMGEVGDIGRRTGMALTISALGALAGPPISGAVRTASGGFRAVGYYAGSTVLLAVVLLVTTRWLVLRRFWGKA